jgi:hypothetical protein
MNKVFDNVICISQHIQAMGISDTNTAAGLPTKQAAVLSFLQDTLFHGICSYGYSPAFPTDAFEDSA